MASALLAGGAALCCLPAARPGSRLDALSLERLDTPRRVNLRRPKQFAALAIGALLLLGLAVEPVCTIAVGLLACTAWRQRSERRRVAAQVSEAEDIAEALRIMTAELRAGAHPSAAAEAAAADVPPTTAEALRSVAASAGTGFGAVKGSPAAFGRLATAWALVGQHGLPMAEVLDAVRRDLDAAARFANRTRAGMAGPRASASILVLLPFVGVALGEAMGASPIRILATTSPGHVLLLAGCGLICVGMAWSARLTRQAVPW
jgi:tight adherence protein B